MLAYQAGIAKFEGSDTQVFGISEDFTPSQKEFAEKNKLTFPLLSDFNKEASAAYGSLYEVFGGWMKGVSKRSAFVIDKEGVVQYAEVLENASDVPDFEAIEKVLGRLNKA